MSVRLRDIINKGLIKGRYYNKECAVNILLLKTNNVTSNMWIECMACANCKYSRFSDGARLCEAFIMHGRYCDKVLK